MWNAKYFLIGAGILMSVAVSANAEGIILRNAKGDIRYMNQYEAEWACPAGTHLPTVRELAKESQSKGAKGILEVNQVNPDEVPEGYYKIWASDGIGGKDEFYYNGNGYKGFDGDMGKTWFWSFSYDSRGPWVFAYYLSARSGRISYDDRKYAEFAVWCFPGRRKP